MRQFTKLTVLLLCFFLVFSGCKKDIQQEASKVLLSEQLVAPNATKLSAAQVERLKQIRASLPAGYEKRMNLQTPVAQKIHKEYRNMIVNRMAVTPTPCSSTQLDTWLDEELADWDFEVIFFALVTGMLDFPTYDALLFGTNEGVYFGLNGEYTQQLNKSFKDIKRFWNIQTNNIVFTAMHGNMLQDRERVIRIDMALYGETREEAEFWADLILELLTIFPQYRNGDHPIFTFNAFAQTAFFYAPVGIVPAKIVMGDGIMEAYKALNYDDVAPQAIMAHELGHHIQFQLDLFEGSGPEATRRTELMADSYSSYFLSHARGATMQWKRVQQFLGVFFNIGDCAFTNPGHHGTPTQRMAASYWGYQVADAAQKQGHIYTAQYFTELFEAKLPSLVAP